MANAKRVDERECMSATTKPCTHCNGTGVTEKPAPRPPVPLTEKEWNIYQEDLTTSVMVALSPTLVAVARAYTAPTDRYNSKKGRAIARHRMREFLPLYLKTGRVSDFGDGNVYTTKYDAGGKAGHIIFEVSPPHDLTDEEETFFRETVLPKFTEKSPEVPPSKVDVPEVLISRPEADGQGPILS